MLRAHTKDEDKIHCSWDVQERLDSHGGNYAVLCKSVPLFYFSDTDFSLFQPLVHATCNSVHVQLSSHHFSWESLTLSFQETVQMSRLWRVFSLHVGLGQLPPLCACLKHASTFFHCTFIFNSPLMTGNAFQEVSLFPGPRSASGYFITFKQDLEIQRWKQGSMGIFQVSVRRWWIHTVNNEFISALTLTMFIVNWVAHILEVHFD